MRVSASALFFAFLLLLCARHARAEDDADWKHQYVLFLVEGLDPTMGLTPRWMPYLSAATREGHGVSAADMRIDDYKFSWITHLYGATRIEFGGSDLAPIEAGYRGLLETRSETYGYSVAVFSDYKEALPENVRRKFRVEGVGRGALFTDEVVYDRLPHTSRRVLLVHMGGAYGTSRSFGYESENYGAQLLCLDWQIETLARRLAEEFPGDSTFAVLSNHGGQGRPYKRGQDELHTALVRVPFGAWGSGVGTCGTCGVRESETTQIAHTLLEAGGLDAPEYWKYELVSEFSPDDADDADLEPASAWSAHDKYPAGVCPVPWGFRKTGTRTFNYIMLAFVALIIVVTDKVVFGHARRNFISFEEIRKRMRGANV